MANENFKLDVTGSDINAVVDLLSDWIDTGYFKINDSMKLNILSNLDDSNLRTDKLTVGKGTIDSVDYLIVAYNNT